MANQKILELEATIKDTTSSTEITDLKKSLNRATTRREEELTRSRTQIDELQKRLDNAGKSDHSFLSFKSLKLDLEKQLTEKDRLIAMKTLEISSMEERYVQYLEKAKMILRQIDPRNNNSLSHQEIQSLRKQLDEKDRKLKELNVNSFSSVEKKNFDFLERIREN